MIESIVVSWILLLQLCLERWLRRYPQSVGMTRKRLIAVLVAHAPRLRHPKFHAIHDVSLSFVVVMNPELGNLRHQIARLSG